MNKLFKKVVYASMGILMSGTILASTGTALFAKSKAEDNKTQFSENISAVSNKNGETVCILPENVYLWNNSTSFDGEYLNGLFEYNSNHTLFQTSIANNEKIREIYRTTDEFNPINNVLKWTSKVPNVTSYTVRVAYDKKFEKCIMKVEDADIEKGVIVENPLIGTTYFWQVIANTENGSKIYSPIFNFKTEETLRTVTVDGVSNTRDIGGYETVYGYVKQGLVYRSARLESITSAGLTTLKENLGVKTDLDLRGEMEANHSGNKPNPARLENYYVYATPQYATFITGDWTADENHPGIIGINGAVYFEDVKNIMTVFADVNNYPIDFHCAVGRDRTGTIACVLKAVLGYKEQDIVNDYFTSMFSTTGAWAKSITATNSVLIYRVLEYLKSFDGATLADKTANYLISKCGMTQEQIDTIRNIMTGKEGYEVEIPAEKTFADENNYSEYAFVTFEQFGVKNHTVLVQKGEPVTVPYELEYGKWYLNGNEYVLSTAVYDDMILTAKTQELCTVKVVCMGAVETEEKTVTVLVNTEFDFSTLQKDGYTYKVVSAEGKVVKTFTVTGDTVLNVIYYK